MNADENEKYGQDGLYFQDDETRYKDDGLDTPLPEEPITNRTDSNYGNTLKGDVGTEDKKSKYDQFYDEENDNEEDNLKIDRPL